MRKLSPFFLTIPLFLSGTLSAIELPATEIKLSKKLKSDPTCAMAIQGTLESTFELLKAKGGWAHVGYASELIHMMLDSGIHLGRALDISRALETLTENKALTPSLTDTGNVLKELLANKDLLVCVTSKTCSISDFPANHLVFVGRGKEAIAILPPAPASDPLQWALNFFSTVASIAGEKVLITWLQKGFQLEKEKKGSADQYYQRFAYRYDGSMPPRPEHLEAGFAIVFMHLYQHLVTQSAFEVLYPQHAEANRKHFVQLNYAFLTRGPNFRETSPIARDLGITSENSLEKAQTLLETIARTINLSNRRN
jgi:hypothetical protein